MALHSNDNPVLYYFRATSRRWFLYRTIIHDHVGGEFHRNAAIEFG